MEILGSGRESDLSEVLVADPGLLSSDSLVAVLGKESLYVKCRFSSQHLKGHYLSGKTNHIANSGI